MDEEYDWYAQDLERERMAMQQAAEEEHFLETVHMLVEAAQAGDIPSVVEHLGDVNNNAWAIEQGVVAAVEASDTRVLLFLLARLGNSAPPTRALWSAAEKGRTAATEILVPLYDLPTVIVDDGARAREQKAVEPETLEQTNRALELLLPHTTAEQRLTMQGKAPELARLYPTFCVWIDRDVLERETASLGRNGTPFKM